jgi:DNA-binding response OmpR family regulator
VLVINDTQEILELFREILEEEGFDVVLSSFGVQEVADVQKINPDLVILDFLVGGEAQGWQLLQKLRMTRETEELPVIVCTAAIQLARELEGHLKAKKVGLVLKPFDIDDLVSAVNVAMKPGAFTGTGNLDA